MKILRNNGNRLFQSDKAIGTIILATSLVFSLMLFPNKACAEILTTDPGLTAAVYLHTNAMKNIHNNRKKMREATLSAQALISGALGVIQDIENKTLNYMTEGSKVLRDLNSVKNIGLEAFDIIQETKNLVNCVPDNLKGTSIMVLCNRKIPEVTTECMELASLISQLVSDTQYSLTTQQTEQNNGNGSTEGKKKIVNLLNSAERFLILARVQDRLNAIRYDVRTMRYAIKAYEWKDIWRAWDYESYIKVIRADYLMKDVISDWNKLSGKKW